MIPWVKPGMSASESKVLDLFKELEDVDSATAKRLLGLQWFVDGISDYVEGEVVEAILLSAEADVSLTNRLLSLQWVNADFLDNELGGGIISFASLVRRNSELAERVLELPWFTDGTTYLEFELLQNLSDLSAERPFLPERLLALQGIADGAITEDDLESIIFIRRIARHHPTLAERIARLAWVQDGVKKGIRENETLVLIYIEVLAFVDLPLAERIVQLNWVADGITENDQETVMYLYNTAGKDVILAKNIVDMPTLSDGISESDLTQIQSIREQTQQQVVELLSQLSWVSDGLKGAEKNGASTLANVVKEFPTMGQRVMRFPWVTDQYEWHPVDEGRVIRSLNTIAQKDLSLGEAVADLPWVADNITQLEIIVLEYLSLTSTADAANQIVGLAVIADGISEAEFEVIKEVSKHSHRDYSVVETVSKLPWVADGISSDERSALSYSIEIAHADSYLAERVLTLPWTEDGISQSEAGAIFYYSLIAQADLSIAQRVAEMPWMGDSLTLSEIAALGIASNLLALDDFNRDLTFAILTNGDEADDQTGNALRILNYTFRNHQRLQELVVSKDWFQDGLTESEAALLIAMDPLERQYDNVQRLLNDGRVISKTLSLPKAGDIRLHLISREGFQNEGEVVRVIETGMLIQETFVAQAWPNNNVILVVEPSWRSPLAGLNRGGDKIILKNFVTDVVFHELAHAYFNSMPQWLDEGGATFLQTYALDLSKNNYGQDELRQIFQNRVSDCSKAGLSTVQDWAEVYGHLPIERVASFPANCHYMLGYAFLQGLYESLGHDAVMSSVRQLHNFSRDNHVSEQFIYETFLSNTPQSKRGQFRALYSQLHGGPIPAN